MAAECERQTPFAGVVELDESYFGAKRIRGKRGRGAGGKTIVFGILKRNDKVYTEIVPNTSKATLQQAIRGGLLLKVSSIPTTGVAITAWLIWAMKSTSGYIMVQTSSPGVHNTLTASSRFGVMPKTAWLNLTVYRNRLFIYT